MTSTVISEGVGRPSPSRSSALKSNRPSLAAVSMARRASPRGVRSVSGRVSGPANPAGAKVNLPAETSRK
jgi:hypothetical protein